MKRKILSIIIAAILAGSMAVMAVGCGCDMEETATPDTATSTIDEAAEATYETVAMDDTDKAIINAGLTVDADGNITDKDGNEVEADEDGNVTVKTEDGKTVTVSTSKVDSANKANDTNEANKAAAIANANANSSSKGSSSSSGKSSSSTSKNNSSSSSSSSSKSSSSSSKTNSSSSSSTSKTNSSSSSSSSSKTSSSSSSSSSSSKTSSSSSSATSDPHAGKTYHEAVYKTIEHPAETQKVWVVDQEAYSYEEPVYETHTICKGCGAYLDEMSEANGIEHSRAHLLAGENDGWYRATVKVSTKTITVPEEGHYETKVVKEAWTEKVLVKEAGW
jgi:hypothetical protein